MKISLSDEQKTQFQKWNQGKRQYCRLHLPEMGGVVLFHHWGEKGLQGSTLSKIKEEGGCLLKLWEEADVIICCHPEFLPSEVRKKHIFPDHKGIVQNRVPTFWLGSITVNTI